MPGQGFGGAGRVFAATEFGLAEFLPRQGLRSAPYGAWATYLGGAAEPAAVVALNVASSAVRGRLEGL